MSTEQIMLGEAKSKYDELTDSILKNAKAKAAADLIKSNSEQIIELEQSLPGLESNVAATDAAYKQAEQRRQEYIAKRSVNPSDIQTEGGILYNWSVMGMAPSSSGEKEAADAAWKAYADANNKLIQLQQANKMLAEQYGIPSTTVFTGSSAGALAGTPGGTTGGTSSAKNKFQPEDDWLALEQSKACLLYTSPSPRDGATSRMPSSA